VFYLRYLDVCLVLATAPFVLLAGLPALGYVLAAAAWVLTRAGVAFIHDRARTIGDPRLRAGLQVGAMMARLWLIALAIIVARYAGGKDDGIMAAAVLLAAFTVYFVMSFFLRNPLQARQKPPAHGSPSAS
jgi:hypothetical protein